MESYGLLKSAAIIELASNDAYAIVSMKDGKKSKVELYSGSGYLSQSAKFVRVTANTASIDVYDFKGNMRTVYPASVSMK